jgi:hypothetical protein
MPWQLQPLIWPLLIATLALLAMPHKAHPAEPSHPRQPSAALVNACRDDALRLCAAQVGALANSKASDKLAVIEQRRDAVEICMKAAGKNKQISVGCFEAIKHDYPDWAE